MDALIKDCERLLKEHDQLRREINTAFDDIVGSHAMPGEDTAEEDGSPPPKLQKSSLQEDIQNTADRLSQQLKELISVASKMSKRVDKVFTPNPGKALQFDQIKALQQSKPGINAAIAQHLFSEGRVHAGEVFEQEAGVSASVSDREAYQAIAGISGDLKQGDLSSAFSWCEAHDDGSDLMRSFMFRLHEAEFKRFLIAGNLQKAVEYARRHLKPYYTTYPNEVRRLIAGLAFSSDFKGPYSSLFHVALDELVILFNKVACERMGLPTSSPISVAVEVGYQSLPKLLKYVELMKKTGQNEPLPGRDELPIALDIQPQHRFHSVFICPVAREIATDENPPMRVPCGHVICNESLKKMWRGTRRRVKCAYCPTEFVMSDTTPLIKY